MDRTGFARGNVSPIIYFRRADGTVCIAVYETGKPEQARRIWEEKFQDWEWCEARTWDEVKWLEKKLVDQEERRRERMAEVERARMGPAKQAVRDVLTARMISGATSPYEREFIRLWFQLREEKRREYEQRFREHHDYLWVCEMDAGTKVDDRMPGVRA